LPGNLRFSLILIFVSFDLGGFINRNAGAEDKKISEANLVLMINRRAPSWGKSGKRTNQDNTLSVPTKRQKMNEDTMSDDGGDLSGSTKDVFDDVYELCDGGDAGGVKDARARSARSAGRVKKRCSKSPKNACECSRRSIFSSFKLCKSSHSHFILVW